MQTRSPILGAILSLVVPGLGQWWLGRAQRGAFIFATTAVLVLLNLVLRFSPLLWLALLPFWAINVVDAYRLAAGGQGRTTALLLLGAVPVYLLGWQITDIDLDRLVSGAGRVQPLVVGLVRPNLIEQEREVAVASQQFYMPCPAVTEPTGQAAATGGSIQNSGPGRRGRSGERRVGEEGRTRGA